eukprot:10792669-Alexandrium_andersonii.AAC.1
MSASLVGSEMCIRDSALTWRCMASSSPCTVRSALAVLVRTGAKASPCPLWARSNHTRSSSQVNPWPGSA